ncbi:hypothetical protein ABZV42_13460, partial [Streptomyces sp. NPDC005281]
LRLLQTVVAVAAEKNSTLVLPFPVELLRFLERAQSGQQPPERPQQQPQPQQQRPPDAPPATDGRPGAGPVEPPPAPGLLGTTLGALGLPEAFADTDGLGIPDTFGILGEPRVPMEPEGPEDPGKPGKPDGFGSADGFGKDADRSAGAVEDRAGPETPTG